MLRSLNKVSLAVCIGLLSAFAQGQQITKELYWTAKSASMQMDTADKKFKFIDTFDKVLRITTPTDCSFYVEPVVQIVEGEIYEMDCGGQQGKGSSAAWDAFYSAKKELKASKLAEAIKGVGDATAKKLVDGGYFQKKPRSWEDFKGAVSKAAAEETIDNNVKNLILSTYRKENMANLGYSIDSCEVKVTQGQTVKVITQGYVVPKICPVVDETVVEHRQVTYNINVTNAAILPAEQDSLTASLSGDASMISISGGYLNQYQIVGLNQTDDNTYEVQIEGTGRNQVALPAQALASVELKSKSKSTATLQVQVMPFALPATNNELLEIKYEVKSCKVVFFGKCGVSWDEKETFTGTLTDEISNFDVSTKLVGKKGIRMEVKVTISKLNSIFHTEKLVSKDTKTIELK